MAYRPIRINTEMEIKIKIEVVMVMGGILMVWISIFLTGGKMHSCLGISTNN